MFEIKISKQFLICPWCYGVFKAKETEDECLKCPICQREVRVEDLENEDDEED